MGLGVETRHDVATLFPGTGEMATRCRDFDWSATPLGPTTQWPAALRSAVRIAIESPFPITLWCGSSLTLIYNDGYRAVLGSKHPGALGRPGSDVWSEIWPGIAPLFDPATGGAGVFEDSARFVMDRADGALGDAFFTFGVLWDAQRHAEHEARVMQSEMPESLKSFSF